MSIYKEPIENIQEYTDEQLYRILRRIVIDLGKQKIENTFRWGNDTDSTYTLHRNMVSKGCEFSLPFFNYFRNKYLKELREITEQLYTLRKESPHKIRIGYHLDQISNYGITIYCLYYTINMADQETGQYNVNVALRDIEKIVEKPDFEAFEEFFGRELLKAMSLRDSLYHSPILITNEGAE